MPVNSSSQFQLTGTEPNNNGITYTNSSIQSSILTPSIGGNTASVTPTGLVQWNTTGATIGQEWFMTVVLTGTNNVKSEIDFIIKITNGGPQNPICLVNGNSNNTIISGSPFSINVSATDPEGQALTITNTTLPSGMGSSISGNSITYNWTPLPTHAGTYTINTTFTDPTNLTTSCAFNMTVIEKKVVSCYEFASNTNDSKGINNGTAIGGSYVTDRFGAASSAYLLNGSSSYVSIPTTNLTNANYSYSAWIKPYSYPTAAIILSIGNTGADQAPGIYGTNMALTSYSHASAPLYPVSFQTGSTAPWKHLVFTMQDNTFKYYIDGNLVLTSSTTGTTTYSTPVLGAIGKRTSASQYFHGEIDDVMITKESLTDGEVLALFQSTSGCPNNVVGSPLITVKQVVGSIFMGIPFNVEALTSSFIANSSNTYQVQLSDVNGTFNTFTTIGTSNNTIISCTIPANMTFSNNYKIRIIATDPALTSINTQNLTITDKRLVSCYSFTGSTNDGKGSNHGIATGGSYTTNRFGIASSAYLLNGTSEFISIPTTDLNNLSYSFSAWIKPYSMPTVSGNPTRTMVSLGNLGGDQSMLFAYNATPATSVLQVAASGVTATTPNYNVNIPTNTAWKHVVGVLQGNTLKYYLDGNLVHTTTTSGNPVYNSPILGQIGRRISGSQYFHGEIDDVMLFKDGLNDAEVLALYTSNSGCPTTVENSRLIVLKPLTNNAICVNTSFNVTFLTSNFTANAGNTYIVQLSDNTGGFGSPTNIGTGTGTTLSCTILNTVAVGSNYKIRIIASNPSLIS